MSIATGASPGGGYLPLSGFGIPPVAGVSDDSVTNFNVPAFTFAGETYTVIGFSSNGYAIIGGGSGASDNTFVNQGLPDPIRPNNVLAPFWTDLNPAAGGFLRIGTLTDGADTWIVLDWDAVSEFSTANHNSFQIWIGIQGDTNPGEDISYAYGAIQGSGDHGLLTVGAENKFGNHGDNYYYNGWGTLPSNGTQLRVTTTSCVACDVMIAPGTSPAGYIPLSSFGVTPVGGVGDDTITNFNLPNPVTFGHEAYSIIGFSSNGYAVLGGGSGLDSTLANQNLPNPTVPNNVLAPFWTDLNPTAAGALRIAELTDGTNSWLVLDWEGVPEFSTLANKHSFQIWLGVNNDATPAEDNSFTYGSNQGNGDNGHLTVGAENKFGSRGQNYYYNGTGTLPSSSTELVVTTTSCSPTPTPAPSPTPVTVGIEAIPHNVSEGNNATFNILAFQAPSHAIKVNYSVSGNARLNVDYTLSGIPGQVEILAGQHSVPLTLHALNDTVREKKENVVITITPGTGYTFPLTGPHHTPKAPKETITILP